MFTAMKSNLLLIVGAWWILVLSALVVPAAIAQAPDWYIQAKVTMLDVSNVGDEAGDAVLYWTVDTNVGGCVAGTNLLYWTPRNFVSTEPQKSIRQVANTRAVMSVLHGALLAGVKVDLYGFNKVGIYCQVIGVAAVPTP